MSWIHQLALRGLVSDRLVRRVVRRRLLTRRDRAEKTAEDPARGQAEILHRPDLPGLWRPATPLAALPDDLVRPVLGDRGLEASAHWPIWAKDLAAAEDEMLGLIAERAAITPNHRTLVVAGRRDSVGAFLADELDVEPVVWTPRPEDAERIARAADRRGWGEVELRSGELAEAVEADDFDRVVAIEAIPAAADPGAFLGALATRLRPGGRLFLQLACHRRHAYRLSGAEARWLDLEVGALVPATDLPPRLAPDLVLRRHWELSGEHYERTARAWRRRLEKRRAELVERAAPALGEAGARHALDRWRLALLARETMFGARGGQEWWVSQYALARPKA